MDGMINNMLPTSMKDYNSIGETQQELSSKINKDRLDSAIEKFKAGRHIIFYRKRTETKVEIIRILHEQMDLKNRILEK